MAPSRPPPDHRRMHESVWHRAEAVAWLDDPTRRGREDPETLWDRAGLAPGMTVVDVGAGTGYYDWSASDRVGAAGCVYAVDVSPELVALVRERARAQGRRNVRAVRSRPERIPLPGRVADRVLLANLLHGVAPATVREAVRLLRPGGWLLDVDWARRRTPNGPPVEHRLSATEARRALQAYGLRALTTVPHGPEHYVVILEKPARPPSRSPGPWRSRRRAGTDRGGGRIAHRSATPPVRLSSVDRSSRRADEEPEPRRGERGRTARTEA